MASEDLSAHIAWLDREATEQEAFAKALAPYSDSMGYTTVGDVVRLLRRTDPSRAEWLLGWARSLVSRGSSLAARSSYNVEFDHNEVQKRSPFLKRAMVLTLHKMGAGTQAFIAGRHSADEEPALADLRAEAVAAYLRQYLPVSRTVAVRPHVCTDACLHTGDRIHLMREAEIRIFVRPEFLAFGPVQHRAQSTRAAHRSYIEIAAGRSELPPDPPAPEPDTERDARHQAWIDHVEAQRAPARAFWESLARYRDEFKYDSIGTLVASIAKDRPAEAARIIETVQAMIDDRNSPHILANLTGQTVQFLPKLALLSEGQEAVVEELLSEMNQRDGGTSVVVSGWHVDSDTVPVRSSDNQRGRW